MKFMLHPKKTQTFKFYSEAWTYVKIMAFIGIIGMTYKIYDAVKNDYDPGEAILNSLDLVGSFIHALLLCFHSRNGNFILLNFYFYY